MLIDDKMVAGQSFKRIREEIEKDFPFSLTQEQRFKYITLLNCMLAVINIAMLLMKVCGVIAPRYITVILSLNSFIIKGLDL